MKTKILFAFLLLASMAYDASAVKVILSGGGRNNKYGYIKLDDVWVICKGRGNINCPVVFNVRDQMRVTHKVDAVVDYVYDQIEKGVRNGKTNFEGSLPVEWTMKDDETLQIDISDDGSTVLEPYEESSK
jgi:hypothetical protein